MATDWKFTDSTRRVVVRINDQGHEESCLVTVDHVQEWIKDGNAPGEPPPEAAPEPTMSERLEALEAHNEKLLSALEKAGVDVTDVKAEIVSL